MKISGSGRLSAGKIEDELNTSGSAKLEGHFECTGFSSSGSFRGPGSLTVHGDIKSSGSFRIEGFIHGDGNAKFSGSTSVGEEVLVKGGLRSSGSFRIGKSVEGLEGIRFSGSARVNGDLLSQNTIDVSESTTINGDVSGDNIIFGRSKMSLNIYKHPYKVHGEVYARSNLELNNAFIDGDVQGRNVIIGKGTEILGKVYYVDSIEVHKKATLASEPIQISSEDLQYKLGGSKS